METIQQQFNNVITLYPRDIVEIYRTCDMLTDIITIATLRYSGVDDLYVMSYMIFCLTKNVAIDWAISVTIW